MAYPNYYPQYYSMPQMQYQQQAQMQNQNMNQQTVQQPQIQNGGFVSVRNELEAKNYPVQSGMSVMFKDETAPYVYTKTMGFSQLDSPIFHKYRLVKEDITEDATSTQKDAEDEKVRNSSLDTVKAEIEAIWREIEILKEPKKTNSRKKEESEE